MKVPEPRKLPSGSWFIHLRLGGESIPVTSTSKQTCIKEAQAIKFELYGVTSCDGFGNVCMEISKFAE